MSSYHIIGYHPVSERHPQRNDIKKQRRSKEWRYRALSNRHQLLRVHSDVSLGSNTRTAKRHPFILMSIWNKRYLGDCDCILPKSAFHFYSIGPIILGCLFDCFDCFDCWLCYSWAYPYRFRSIWDLWLSSPMTAVMFLLPFRSTAHAHGFCRLSHAYHTTYKATLCFSTVVY